jgi:hypothetical protein
LLNLCSFAILLADHHPPTPHRLPCSGMHTRILRWGEQLVVQDDIQQRGVDLQPAVVVNKAQFSEPVHEEADPLAGCAHHLCQHLLTDLGNYPLPFSFLAKMGKQ